RASTDEYVESCGGIGICFETGWEKDTSTRAVVTESILNILADQGLMKPDGPLRPPKRKYRKYQFSKRVPLTKAGFRYAGDYSGSFQDVKKGEIIGYHGDVPEIAEEDSAIVLQKSREKWAIGDELFFLARRVK
ncbi:MAG: hypothetical protein LUQ42_04385, partial [Methanomicrobiales archaeon]|nr:hypothetical protein [Methanomicrobiales archaeon]